MAKQTICIEVDEVQLRRYQDSYLATLWHVGQANPAPFGDEAASDLAEKIGGEIVRRWLSAVEPELWHHQGRHHYWEHLRRFAKWDGETWVARRGEGDD